MKVHIIQDIDAMSPRDWDNLGTMVCWHNKYNLGDEQPYEDPEDWIKNLPKGTIYLPLYLYDHSGITMNCSGFSCLWDSGQVGWIYVTPEKIRKEFGVKRISKKTHNRVIKCLEAEVKIYDQYLRGACWGFELENDNGDSIDSCYGFFGDNLDETGIKDHLDSKYHNLAEDVWHNL